MAVDVIRLLPDAVANQIAAGEVIQRPASVIKELVENAIDAGATNISVLVKEAGRTLIQVVDNGRGMSVTDARLAFERHATSKIQQASDLFALHTMGFRGEALASIAAVAQVELKTRQEIDEVGTRIVINGSEVELQEPVITPVGSTFCIKNLFYNIPARRKFLKSNQTELSHIITEFERIALANPSIQLSLANNNTMVYDLASAPIRQRIAAIFGKQMNQTLIPIDLDTPMVNVHGYVSTPDGSRKTNQKQFFFVNGRYMRHPYFHKAVMHPYEGLLQQGQMPHYFLYFDVDPATIDVNIHPTKTEISFENGPHIWQIIAAAVKETLGRHNEVPSIDFDREDALSIPIYKGERNIAPPQPRFDTNYNPFKTSNGYTPPVSVPRDWSKLFPPKAAAVVKREVEPDRESVPVQESLPLDTPDSAKSSRMLLFRNRYLLAPSRSGLLVIHFRRAHIRVLYDKYLRQITAQRGYSQRVLFPEVVTFAASDVVLLDSIADELHYLGFEVDSLGGGSYAVNAIPAGMEPGNPQELFDQLLDSVRSKSVSIREEAHRQLALTLARAAACTVGNTPSAEEQQHLLEQLMASSDPSFTPDGQKILTVWSDDELEKMF